MANVSMAPDWGQHFHDDNGNPASGWKVYVFESNTEDYKISYSDPAGTILHTQPIILNARGEYPGQGLYLLDGEAYTLELRTPTGTVKKTVDNVYGVSGGGGSGGDIVLPAQTVLGNITAGTTTGYPVKIEQDLDLAESNSNIPNVGAVLDKLGNYLPNSGDNTYDGDLVITGSLDVESLTIDGTPIDDIYVKKDGHAARSLVGNIDTAVGLVEDIAIQDSLASGSNDAIPTVAAVKTYIDNEVSDLEDQIDAIGPTNKVSVNGSDVAGYLGAKMIAGDGITITDIGGQLLVESDTSALTGDAFAIYGNNLSDDFTNPAALNKFLQNWTVTPSIDNGGWDAVAGKLYPQSAGKYSVSFSSYVNFPYNPTYPTSASSCNITLIHFGSDNTAKASVYSQNIIPKYTRSNSGVESYVSEIISNGVFDVEIGDYFSVFCQRVNCFLEQENFSAVSCGVNSPVGKYSRVIFVSNSGNDINSGLSPASPKETLSAAIATAKSKQLEEGGTEFWTVICEDESIFTEAGDLQIPPYIGCDIRLSTFTCDTLSVCNGTEYNFGKLFCADFYVYGNIDLQYTRNTTVNIDEINLTSADMSYGVYTAESYDTIDRTTTTFNITKVFTQFGTGLNLNGILGNVSGGVNKTTVFNVDTLIAIGSYAKPEAGIVWNNTDSEVVANIGSVESPLLSLVSQVANGKISASVQKSNTRHLCYSVGTSSKTVITGGYLNCINELGYVAQTPNISISGELIYNGQFDITNATNPVINLSSIGKISVNGSDSPEHLVDKIVAGFGIAINETNGTLVVESTGEITSGEVKVDSSDELGYLGDKVIGAGAVDVVSVMTGPDTKQLMIVGTGKVNADVTDDEPNYLIDKLKAGNHITLGVVEEAGIRKVEITADGQVTRLEDLEDVDVDVITREEGQVIVFNETTQMWENVNSEIIYLTEPVTVGQVLTFDGTYWTNQTPSAGGTPGGASGTLQYNNAGSFGGTNHTYENTQDGSLTSWKINRLRFNTPAADTKTTGISRISYLNASELMIWASNSGSSSIEICSSDLPTRTTYAIFSPTYTHLRQLYRMCYNNSTVNVDDYQGISDMVVDGPLIIFTGSVYNTGTVKMTALVTAADASHANAVVKLVNKSIATLSFYTYSIGSNETCEFLYNGNGGIGNPTFTLLGRYPNI